ncbi:MAG: LPS export ABC transporter ATP-binding protein [Candidatus Competibacteraceae bacterium]|nr:LPS export ABC transporter ATP-binding protein [Candidatus Competibacteraceae bacterium]
MSQLIAKELVKRFKKRLVVDAATVQVNSGEVVGLLGPNGAGKTTCFYMVVGLIACDEGHVTLDGKDITHLPMHVRARRGLGYLPQEPSVFRKLTVFENIMAILELRRDLTRSTRRQLALDLLHELHVGHLKDSAGISLSGGERRRVEIARALAANPSFILLDEPFAGVDPLSVMDIQRIIGHLCRREIGVLITDHNVRETLGICHRAYILNAGRVIAEGTPATILADPQVREVYLGESFTL